MTEFICPSCHEYLGYISGTPCGQCYGKFYVCTKCGYEGYLSEFEHNVKGYDILPWVTQP